MHRFIGRSRPVLLSMIPFTLALASGCAAGGGDGGGGDDTGAPIDQGDGNPNVDTGSTNPNDGGTGDGATNADSTPSGDSATADDSSTAGDSSSSGDSASSGDGSGGDAPSCTDACAPAATRCATGAVDGTQSCDKQSSGCYDWSAVVACTGGSTCSASGSAATCVPCTSGAKRCDAAGNVETCSSGAWTETQACSFGCSSGTCTASVTCTAGSYRCDGNDVEICNSSGTAYLYEASCTVACAAGLCTGACTPGAKRCNGAHVETCNADGTAWAVSDTCTSVCDAATNQCALDSLTIDPTTTKSFDGVIVVNGPVVVHAGATLKSDTGNLTIRATSITVEANGSIAVAATGTTPDGAGAAGYSSYNYYYGYTYYPATGGNYNWGSDKNADVAPGSQGGIGGAASGGHGGGVLRLMADTISIAGTVSANGENAASNSSYQTFGPGGGSGGGILVAADQLTISGTISAAGGNGNATNASYAGGNGGLGRVKLLYGSKNTITGTITGTKTQALLPPLRITSTTHPDPTLVYNDDFGAVALTWNKPFPSVQGYYQLTDMTTVNVPTPANALFVPSELTSISRDKIAASTNFFHIVSIDAASNVGLVEGTFKITVNSTPPTVTSTSHPSSTTWSTNPNVFFGWTIPVADANEKGFYYVLDHYGTTVPKATDTFVPITQKSLLRSALTDGVWAFHVVAVDQRGYLTKQGGHYRVRLGADPGSGSIVGTVSNSSGKTVANAKVTVNRGLFNFAGEAPDQTTGSDGTYGFAPKIPAGSWEVTVTDPTSGSSKTQVVTVSSGASATANFTLP